MYGVQFKNRTSLSLFFSFFFCKVILRWKWRLRNNRGVLEDSLKGNRREKQAKEKKEKKKEKKRRETTPKNKTKQKKKKERKKKNKFFSLIETKS